MTENKKETPTKTIAFRWPSNVVDSIKESAKEKGISMQDYFMTQISPTSELMKFIILEQEKMLLESKAVADMRHKMAEDAKRIMESSGLSLDQFADLMSQAVKSMVKPSDTDEK